MSSTHAVQLWFCPLSGLDEDINNLAMLRSVLSDDERLKVDRYRFPMARLQALYVRCYLRTILSRYADSVLRVDLTPKQWVFKYESHGKPRLCDEQYALTGIEFNISHSGDYLLVAIMNTGDKHSGCAKGPNTRQPSMQESRACQLGVDIEKSRAETDIGSIHHHYFSALESSRLLALDETEQRGHFFDLWALKESYIKAVGKGLAIPLDSFGFDMSCAVETRIALNDHLDIDHRMKAEATKKEMAAEVTLIQGVRLERQTAQQCENSQETAVWLSYLGRLDDEYRFAVTLGLSSLESDQQSAAHVDIKANWLCSSQLMTF